MDHVVARYGEIGIKSKSVRKRMVALLEKRIRQKLDRQEVEYEFLSKIQGRIVIKTLHSVDVSKIIAEVPGVVSTSPIILAGIDMKSIRIASDKMEIRGDFGVRVNRSSAHEKTSGEVEKDIGERIQNRTKASVNLRDPNTWVEIDIREKHSFIFSERNRGSGGFPVGSEGALATLISGGIDSPVASYEVMTRGCDITPIYFYNRPMASEDHIARFEEVLRVLTKFHPAKRWHYYIIDMEEVNTQLLEIERGRMVLHRMVMFRVAEGIAVENGLNGIVTGEVIGQKSSQTPENIAVTSSEVRLPVLRPLLTRRKEDIVEAAKKIGTFELANMKSACSTLAPSNPATAMKMGEIELLKERVNFEELVAIAKKNIEKVTLKV